MSLLYIVPSRGRPSSIAQLQAAWKATVTLPNSHLLVAVDACDPELANYQKLPDINLWVGPRLRMAGTLNRVAVEKAPFYDYLGFMGDDHRPRTPGWDALFVAELQRLGTGVVYGNDLLARERLPTSVVMTADIVRTLGYMAPPGLIHLYLDDSWLAWGRGLGKLSYMEHIIVEHLHPYSGKADWDDIYRECNNDALAEEDHAHFRAYCVEQLAADLARIRREIGAI